MKFEGRLNRIQKDGSTLRELCEVFQRQTGKPHPLSIFPSNDDSHRPLLYLYQTFLEIQGARQGTGFGVNLLTWSEIRSYCYLFNLKFEPWEVRMIKRIDAAYMTELNKKDSE